MEGNRAVVKDCRAGGSQKHIRCPRMHRIGAAAEAETLTGASSTWRALRRRIKPLTPMQRD
eukprot:8464669-Pyramimonas_sp.AAC.2